MKKQTKSERKSTMISMLMVVITLGMADFGMFEGLTSRGLDLLFQLRGTVKPITPIILVLINDDSFVKMPERWVWPRSYHARLIRNIAPGKPRVIAFDLLFTEPTSRKPDEDAEFASVCRKAGNVILASEIVQGERHEVRQPIGILQDTARISGFVNTPADSDMHIRRACILGPECKPSLAFATFLVYSGLSSSKYVVGGDKVKIGSLTIPFAKGHGSEIYINYRGGAGTFQTVPYYKVFYGEISSSVFTDAIVLVGAGAPDLHDVFPTPFTWCPSILCERKKLVPGIEIIANTIETLATRQFIRNYHTLDILFPFAFAYPIPLLVLRIRTIFTLAYVFSMGIGSVILAGILFRFLGVYLDYVTVLISLMLTFGASVTYRAAISKLTEEET